MSSINVKRTFYKVADFLSWKKIGTLDLNPAFQRRSVWKPGAKSYLIDTIVRGLTIPNIFLRDRGVDLTSFEAKREVIDGQQRLRTIMAYVDPSLLNDFDEARDSFTVKEVHNKEMANKQFRELPSELQQRILDYEFVVHILPSTVDDQDVIQIFRRMNSTSYNLNAQELRNAGWFGEFKTSMYLLAAEQLNRWRESGWGTFTEDNIARMYEVELTSEFALLIIRGEIMGKSQASLDNAYDLYDETFPNRGEIERRFRITMDILDERLGRDIRHLLFKRRSVIYSLFACFYDNLFGLKSSLENQLSPHTISQEQIAWIKQAGERIETGTAPKEVLDATTRRTTNPKERGILFDYLIRKQEK
jgi:hypothetical protein